jgi:immune inhibitor A
MANYYLDASSGKYSVNGYVSDWVQVPYNEAAYGSNYCGSIVCTRDIGRFIEDQADTWWTTLVAQKGSVAAANAFLAGFDKWDRYDYNGNGIYNEPDGYIDHFQSVHAGVGEETGGGAQGTDAIWSHRSYVNSIPIGADGPPGGPAFGGAHIGASNYCIGDYTIEPENGGVGVFAHEFGHDLGLPDEYDTSGNTGGAENSTAWWTTWSQGSYGTQTNDGIGNYPVSMTGWERYQLGFYDLNNIVVMDSSDRKLTTLGPSEYNNKKNQFIVINLPDKQVTQNIGTAQVGPDFFYSGSDDDMDTLMHRSVTSAAAGTVTALVKYNTEADFDYFYLTVNGAPVHTNLSSATNPNGNNFGEGITGVSSGWVSLTANVPAGTYDLGFEYITDPAQQGQPGSPELPGVMIDGINVSGVGNDLGGFTFESTSDNAGFHVTNGVDTNSYFNAYVLENRTFYGYDKSLKTGPYNFGFPTAPNKVEHFSDQDGLLVWYWNTQYSDNNVGDHPGEGEILPVDAHPNINKWADGTQMRPRINAYDSTFGLERTQSITLHNPADGVAKTIPSQWGNPLFDDTKSYWVSGDPSDAPANGRYQAEWNSVKLPAIGVKVRVLINLGDWMVLKIN